MANLFKNIFRRDNSTVTIETTGSVPKSESTEESNFISALSFNMPSTFAALKLSAVYAALSLISNSIATMPIYVKQRKDKQNTIVENHAVQKLFYDMLQSKHTVIKQIVLDLYLHGNAFCYIKRDNNGKPVKLIYMQYGDVTIDYKKEQDLVQYNCSNHKSVPSLVKQADMLHFARDTKDGVIGRPITLFAADVINLSGYTQNAAKDFFGSGCNLTGILQFKRPLKPGQQEQIRSQWMQIHGSGVSGGLGVLEGDSEYIPISQNSADSQMLETRAFNIAEIARYFNINPVLLGDLTHNSYNTIEDANIEFIQRTLLPIINLLEEEINRKLITNRNQYIDIDETELLKGDKQTLASYYTSLVQNAIITVDEAREALGYNPLNTDYSSSLIIPFTKIEDNVLGDVKPSEESEENEKELE